MERKPSTTCKLHHSNFQMMFGCRTLAILTDECTLDYPLRIAEADHPSLDLPLLDNALSASHTLRPLRNRPQPLRVPYHITHLLGPTVPNAEPHAQHPTHFRLREARRLRSNPRYRNRGFPFRHGTHRRAWSARNATQPCEQSESHESVRGRVQLLRASLEECESLHHRAQEAHPRPK